MLGPAFNKKCSSSKEIGLAQEEAQVTYYSHWVGTTYQCKCHLGVRIVLFENSTVVLFHVSQN